MEKLIIFDDAGRRLADAQNKTIKLADVMARCDRRNLCIAKGSFSPGDFQPDDLTGAMIELGFGRPDAFAQKGDWTAIVGADITQPLTPGITAGTLQAYLNELQSVIDAGGLKVLPADCDTAAPDARDCSTSSVALSFQVCWNTVGDKPDILENTNCLWPETVTTISVLRQGDATCKEIVNISQREKMLAFENVWTPKAPSVVTPSELQAGGGGNNAVQQVKIDPSPTGGNFCLDIAGCQTGEISVFASSAQFLAALECVGQEFQVLKTGYFTWEIAFMGDQAVHPLMTVVCEAVQDSGGAAGLFVLNSVPVNALLEGCNAIEGMYELKITEADGTVCRYTEKATILRSMIDLANPGQTLPPAGIVFAQTLHAVTMGGATVTLVAPAGFSKANFLSCEIERLTGVAELGRNNIDRTGAEVVLELDGLATANLEFQVLVHWKL